MTQTLTAQVEEIAKLRHETATAVIAEALEVGVAKLYQESILRLLLRKKIPRQHAIQLVGVEVVRLAEQQDRATQEDVAWGLGHG